MPAEGPQNAYTKGETSGMKILCAIDGSRHSQWALDWLLHICSPEDCSLLLVHAVDMTQFKSLSRLDRKTRSALVNLLECSLEGAARVLEWAELKASTSWGPVRAKLLRGSPADAVARLAKREQANLIVGSRSGRSANEYFMGNVADRVVKHAPCSVLVYRSEQTDGV